MARERSIDKRSHLGMAGHHAAMSEFLYRGYNVAVPAVDIGDDVYVVEDRLGTMWRLQVKTSDQPESYQLSRRQLRELKENELFFMFMRRWGGRWRFILIRRDHLADIRDRFVQRDRTGRPGRRPMVDGDAKTDALNLTIEWTETDAIGWGESFASYLDCWPAEFPENPDGPGAIRGAGRSPDL
jgi:hypothetical protein